MNDLYKEIMVKPRPSQTNALKKGLLIAAAVLVFDLPAVQRGV